VKVDLHNYASLVHPIERRHLLRPKQTRRNAASQSTCLIITCALVGDYGIEVPLDNKAGCLMYPVMEICDLKRLRRRSARSRNPLAF
jgi:hypothetical protein